MAGVRSRASLLLRPPLLLGATLVGLAVVPGAAAAPREVPPTQELAVFVQGQTAMTQPTEHSPGRAWVDRNRPITEGRTVLPVLEHRQDADGNPWLRVRLPGRPNNRTGWIRKARTSRAVTPWHLVVDLSERTVTVYRGGRAVRSFSAVIGAPRTPTPRGGFFVEETVLLRPGDVGAPYALALSARSPVLQQFAGGPGQIALHGIRNVGGIPGSAASHGCLRLPTSAITWLGERIGPGVPVTVGA